jgi:hypothetical protein
MRRYATSPHGPGAGLPVPGQRAGLVRELAARLHAPSPSTCPCLGAEHRSLPWTAEGPRPAPPGEAPPPGALGSRPSSGCPPTPNPGRRPAVVVVVAGRAECVPHRGSRRGESWTAAPSRVRRWASPGGTRCDPSLGARGVGSSSGSSRRRGRQASRGPPAGAMRRAGWRQGERPGPRTPPWNERAGGVADLPRATFPWGATGRRSAAQRPLWRPRRCSPFPGAPTRAAAVQRRSGRTFHVERPPGGGRAADAPPPWRPPGRPCRTGRCRAPTSASLRAGGESGTHVPRGTVVMVEAAGRSPRRWPRLPCILLGRARPVPTRAAAPRTGQPPAMWRPHRGRDAAPAPHPGEATGQSASERGVGLHARVVPGDPLVAWGEGAGSTWNVPVVPDGAGAALEGPGHPSEQPTGRSAPAAHPAELTLGHLDAIARPASEPDRRPGCADVRHSIGRKVSGRPSPEHPRR